MCSLCRDIWRNELSSGLDGVRLMSERTPMTLKGHKVLSEELQRLKYVERPKASKAIEVAREHGDLSENAEYDAAKQAQGLLEAKIRDLESKLGTAQVVDVSTLSGDRVVFGATVKICCLDDDERREIYIVGEDEANAALGFLSYKSPLARALIGKQEGDVVQVKLPSGEKDYEILAVSFAEK